MKNTVWIVYRWNEGERIVDKIFKTEKQAEKYLINGIDRDSFLDSYPEEFELN